METNATKRASVIAKVRALLAKTTEAGATEEEALSAAAKAGELMERYRIEMSDIQIREEPVIRNDIKSPNKSRRAPGDHCLAAIARFTGTKVWIRSSRYHHRTVTFFGLEADVMFAGYLYGMINSATDVAVREFKKTAAYREESYYKRDASSSFVAGMTSRISRRLYDLCKTQATAITSNGTALVVIKNQIVESAFAELGLRLRSASYSHTSIRNSGAFESGRAAGDKVRFDRPLGGSAARAALR